jgi:hypothetical protein
MANEVSRLGCSQNPVQVDGQTARKSKLSRITRAPATTANGGASLASSPAAQGSTWRVDAGVRQRWHFRITPTAFALSPNIARREETISNTSQQSAAALAREERKDDNELRVDPSQRH